MALIPLNIVLTAYADAYPDNLTVEIDSDYNTAKFFPAYTYDNKRINSDFIKSQDNEEQINEHQMTDPECGEKTVAFVPHNDTGSWGYFKANDVDPYVTFADKNVITVDFKEIQKITDREYKKVVFHRALTMIYGQKHKDANYFFDPFDHIEKAAGLKGTVDIMIGRKENARARARGAV